MLTHLPGWLLPVLSALALLLAVPQATSKDGAPRRVVGYGQIRYEGHGPEAWAQRARLWRAKYVATRRELLTQRQVLRHRPSVVEAINLACATYGHCPELWRKARCETGGTFSPRAYNPSGATGLFQFLPSTFRSTPYAVLSIWSPYANAMAAGWMHARGRGGEWTCR